MMENVYAHVQHIYAAYSDRAVVGGRVVPARPFCRETAGQLKRLIDIAERSVMLFCQAMCCGDTYNGFQVGFSVIW